MRAIGRLFVVVLVTLILPALAAASMRYPASTLGYHGLRAITGT